MIPDPTRPDPDALLADVTAEAPSRNRGRLKVFLGAVAGVGKTYAMLEAAWEKKREGLDVAVGVVETHGRQETETLLEGLPVIPRRVIEHRGVTVHEFDLAAALERHPSTILVDELAHTNAPGSVHHKRWQDIEELREAGIDVFTTVNVQHLESVNDVVARITHVRVRETVPDSVLEGADEVELIDLPPGELLERLEAGKVYVPEQIRRAKESFFRRGNLIALRQLALRYTAEHVDDAMLTYRRAYAVSETWPVRDRLLVGVGPAPSSQNLVRAAKRMADSLRCDWHVVFVETPAYAGWPKADQHRVWETLRLAAELGAETASFAGSGTRALLDYARKHNVTKLIVGKPSHSSWRDRVLGSQLEDMIRASGDIDVHVITGEPGAGRRPHHRSRPSRPLATRLGLAALAITACTVAAIALRDRFALANLIMLYLLVVVAVSVRLGRAASVVASILAVAAFDWFCVPPYGTFAVADTQYVLVFVVMLIVALLISGLAARLRAQAEASRNREQRTAALLAASRELVSLDDPIRIAEVAVRHVGATFNAQMGVYAPDPFGRLRGVPDNASLDDHEHAVAHWVMVHGTAAGRGTSTLPEAKAMWIPLAAGRAPLGVLSVAARDPAIFRHPERMQLLMTFAGQIAAAFERARLAVESRRTQQLIELNRLKTEFIAVAAHELRTPLTSLGMAVELLAERFQDTADLLDTRARKMLDVAVDDVRRLRILADDLLDLSRLESRGVTLDLSAQPPAPLVEAVVEQVALATDDQGPEVRTEVPPDLPSVVADRSQIERALRNLIENAIRHAGPAGHVIVSVDALPDFVQFSVIDDGPGIPVSEQDRIFEAFVGGQASDGHAGLGLAIVRGIVRAHGGDVWVDSGPGPGAAFSFTLPTTGRAPTDSGGGTQDTAAGATPNRPGDA